jgi:hypothetical protein
MNIDLWIWVTSVINISIWKGWTCHDKFMRRPIWIGDVSETSDTSMWNTRPTTLKYWNKPFFDSLITLRAINQVTIWSLFRLELWAQTMCWQ